MPKHLIHLALFLSLTSPAWAGPTEDLVTAVQQGKGALAEQALLAGADPNIHIPLGEYFSTHVVVWAVRYNNFKLLTLALEKGGSPDARGTTDQQGAKSALEVAATNKNTDVIKILLTKGAKISEKDIETLVQFSSPAVIEWILKHHTPTPDLLSKGIETALSTGQTDSLKLLLDALPIEKLNTTSLGYGFYYACLNDHPDALQVLLPRLKWHMLPGDIAESFYRVGNEGHLKIAELLLSHWAKESKASKAFGEMLHGAAVNGHTQIITKILQTLGTQGLPKEAVAEWITRAATYNQPEVLQQLLAAYGSSVFTPAVLRDSMVLALDGICDDNEATLQKCRATWQFLLDHGVNLNTVDKDGNTLLLLVAQSSRASENLKWLLSNGANIHAINKDGKNALYYALANQNQTVIAALRQAGAKMNATVDDFYDTDLTTEEILKLLQPNHGARVWLLKNKVGQSWLFRAVTRREVATVKQALAQGLSVKERDKSGTTPLLALLSDEAGWSLYDNTPELKEITILLLNKGADINAQDNQGLTLLHRIFGQMSLNYLPEKGIDNTDGLLCLQDLTRFLISKGANLQLKNKKGQTISTLAKELRDDLKQNDYYLERHPAPNALTGLDDLLKNFQV